MKYVCDECGGRLGMTRSLGYEIDPITGRIDEDLLMTIDEFFCSECLKPVISDLVALIKEGMEDK